jgi:hypothetical protein
VIDVRIVWGGLKLELRVVVGLEGKVRWTRGATGVVSGQYGDEMM